MKFMIAILGWALWNWAELTIEKKSLDEDGNPQTNFSLRDFTGKKWALWIGSLICIPIILWIEASQLSLDPLEPLIGMKLGWNEFYILASGPAFEFVIFSIIRVQKFFKNK